MRPVDQTKFGYPGGNCFSACVASLLELDLVDVPYFMGTEGTEDWYVPFAEWLMPHGFYPVCFKLPAPLKDTDWRPAGLHILSGPAPRGLDHSVVARGPEIVHDPHPSRAGLLSLHDVILLVPFDPARQGTAGGGRPRRLPELDRNEPREHLVPHLGVEADELASRSDHAER